MTRLFLSLFLSVSQWERCCTRKKKSQVLAPIKARNSGIWAIWRMGGGGGHYFCFLSFSFLSWQELRPKQQLVAGVCCVLLKKKKKKKLWSCEMCQYFDISLLSHYCSWISCYFKISSHHFGYWVFCKLFIDCEVLNLKYKNRYVEMST